MFQALLLIVFGTLLRLLPNTLNLVPMGAIALFAGSRFPRRLAWSIPVFAMIFSDIVMDHRYGGYFHSPTRWITYATFALIALLGVFAKGSKANIFRLAGLSLSGSILFFLASNFGCWAWPEGGTVYAANFSGLMDCYIAGLPFLRNTVMGDFLGTAILFGGAPLLAGLWSRVRPAKSSELVAAGSASAR